jgi:hypothetical protein
MIPADQHAEGVLSLPTPLARLYGVALQKGIHVTDGRPVHASGTAARLTRDK